MAKDSAAGESFSDMRLEIILCLWYSYFIYKPVDCVHRSPKKPGVAVLKEAVGLIKRALLRQGFGGRRWS